MNNTEAVLLLRKVRAYRPAMIIDDLTGAAWQEALDDIRLEDATAAVREIGRRTSDWIDPAMVRAEVKKIRGTRVNAGEAELTPPPWRDQQHYLTWLLESRQRLANGETPAAINASTAARALTARPIDEVLAIAAPRRVADDTDPDDGADHQVKLQPGPEGPICGVCEQRAVRLKPGKWAHAARVDA
jgi:hypothetical protein